jgi:hypothetical protein
VDRKLVRGQTMAGERGNRFGGNAGGCPAPAGVKERHNPRRMRDKYRDAVSYSKCKRYSLLGRDMAIRLFSGSQPAFPTTEVDEDARSVNLPDRHQPASGVGQLPLQ